MRGVASGRVLPRFAWHGVPCVVVRGEGQPPGEIQPQQAPNENSPCFLCGC